jgi:hypothetical protein
MSTTISSTSLKDFLRGVRSDVSGSAVMSRMISPLDDEFKDGDYEFVRGIIDYVPFLDCGDATLRVLRNMTQLSPTHGACIRLKTDYALSGGLGLKVAGDKIMRQNNRERVISDGEHDDFVGFLDMHIGIDSLTMLLERIAFNHEGFGNRVVEIVLTQTAGVRSGSVNAYDATMFRYAKNGKYIDHTRGYLSQRWDYSYINRNRNLVREYAVSRINPNSGKLEVRFSEHEDGTFRTLLHLFTPALDRSSYGLPPAINSIYWQYLEFQMGKYHTRAYQNQLLPALIVESYNLPTGEPEDKENERGHEQGKGFDNSFAGAFNRAFTNYSDAPKGAMIHMEAPHGTAASTFFTLSPPTQEGYYKTMSEITASQIMKSHNVNKLLFERTAGSIGASTETSQAAALFDKTVIRPMQEAILLPIRIAIDEIAKWVGYSNPSRLMLDLKTTFERETVPTAPATIIPPNNTI